MPSGLDDVLQSSDFLRVLMTKAIETDGGAEGAAGGVLAIDMFGLGEDEITKLHTNARDVYTELAIRWMLKRELVLPDRKVADETKWRFLPRVNVGSNDVKKRNPVRRGYELDDDQKRKLAVAREKKTGKTSLYWTVAYIILMMEKGGNGPDGENVIPLSLWEMEGAKTIYKIISQQRDGDSSGTVQQPAETEGDGSALYSAASPESSDADFRF